MVAPAPRVQSPIDTRFIGKPEQFTGASGWKDWSVVMRSYASAINPVLGTLMVKAETTEDVIDNLHLSAEQDGASTLLYHLLVMTCREQALTRVVNAGQAEGLLAW
eukprot:1856316-Amphidinium_carterae.1